MKKRAMMPDGNKQKSVARQTAASSTLSRHFVQCCDHALGRPVGVALGKQGALLVADDVGNAIWRVRVGR